MVLALILSLATVAQPSRPCDSLLRSVVFARVQGIATPTPGSPERPDTLTDGTDETQTETPAARMRPGPGAGLAPPPSETASDRWTRPDLLNLFLLLVTIGGVILAGWTARQALTADRLIHSVESFVALHPISTELLERARGALTPVWRQSISSARQHGVITDDEGASLEDLLLQETSRTTSSPHSLPAASNEHSIDTRMFGFFRTPKNEDAGGGLRLSGGGAHAWPDALVKEAATGPLASPGGPPGPPPARPITRPIYWLDRFLDGGIRIPAGLARPLRILVKGPPGLGKSVFVQQLLYSQLFPYDDPAQSRSSVHVTTEAPPEAVLANMKSLGMHVDTPNTRPSSAEIPLQLKSGPDGIVAEPKEASTLWLTRYEEAGHVSTSKNLPLTAGVNTIAASSAIRGLQEKAEALFKQSAGPAFAFAFDSVNSLLKPGASSSVLAALFDWPKRENGRPPLCVIFVYDEDVEEASGRWSHAADLVFQFHLVRERGYTWSEFEIQKARFQGHVKGRHPVTLYGNDPMNRPLPGPPAPTRILRNIDLGGPRPRLREGGLYAFPNHHFLMDAMRNKPGSNGLRVFEQNEQGHPFSGQARQDPGEAALADFGIRPGDRALLVGPLGSMRREFAATWARLAKKCRGGERASLLVSFAEPFHWYNELVAEDANGDPKPWSDLSAEEQKRTKKHFPVLQQRPGSVLPAEFLHRLLYWCAEIRPSVVIVVGLDGLPSLFPELAAQPQLVPTMIEVFRAHRIITLIPIAGSFSPGKDPQAPGFGLTQHANHILDFEASEPPSASGAYSVGISQRKGLEGWRSAPHRKFTYTTASRTWNKQS